MTTTDGNGAPHHPYSPLSCAGVDALYAPAQRRTIKRVMEGWLHRHRLTVTEFLHSAAALEKFESAGTTYQHAIQRMAVTLSSRSKLPVVEYIKALNALVTAGIRRIYKDEREGLFPVLEATAFAEFAEVRSADPRQAYLLDAVLTKYLASAASWADKLDRLLGLFEANRGHRPAAEPLFAGIDRIIAEIVGDPVVIKELLGSGRTLHEGLLLAIDVVQGAEDARLDGTAESLKRLAASFARDELGKARGALARYVLEMLQGTAPLTVGSLDAELGALRTLVDAITPLFGPLFDAGDFADAFSRRCKRFVTQEALFKLTEDCKRPDERLARLLDLEGQLEGAANKRALAPFALAFLTVHNFEEEFAPGAPGAHRLKRLADLQRRVLRSTFPEGVRDKMAGILDAMAVRVETQGRLFAGLDSRFADPAERVDMILKLFENGVFTAGSLSSKARRALLAGIARPGFLEAYTAPRRKERQAALMELVAQLKKIGISPEESLHAMSSR